MSPVVPPTDWPAGDGLARPDGRSPAKVREAAQQFEALLIGQILRSVHESGGWLGSTDSSADSATEYAEQQLAMVIAQRGGLGLADLIASGLEAKDGAPAPAPSKPAPAR
jgi:Rod binding domain-containing protein